MPATTRTKARFTTTERWTSTADAVFLKVYADDKLFKTETQKLAADKAYAFTVKLKPGLIKYKVEFGTKTGGAETVVQTVDNLVCGDAYLIDGQSNALATIPARSLRRTPAIGFAVTAARAGEVMQPTGFATVSATPGSTGRDRTCGVTRSGRRKRPRRRNSAAGAWSSPSGSWQARRCRSASSMGPSAAPGSTSTSANEADPADLNTIYGRMLWRVQQARLTHGIRAVLWHQGESDQGSDGPDGGYGWESYQQYFLDMSAAWKQDLPNIRHYYVFQIWPNSCSMGNGHGDMLREVQRTLPRLYSNMDIMSTLGIKPPGPCHYPLTGWAEFARLMQPLIERDFYGKVPTASITAPNLKQAYYTSSAKERLPWSSTSRSSGADSLAGQFYLDGEAEKVASGHASPGTWSRSS